MHLLADAGTTILLYPAFEKYLSVNSAIYEIIIGEQIRKVMFDIYSLFDKKIRNMMMFAVGDNLMC